MEGWTVRRFHLGQNKEVFDTELYALYQATKIFDEREESGQLLERETSGSFCSVLCSPRSAPPTCSCTRAQGYCGTHTGLVRYGKCVPT